MVLYQQWILAVTFEVRKKDRILNSPNLPRRIDHLALIAVSATGQKMEDKKIEDRKIRDGNDNFFSVPYFSVLYFFVRRSISQIVGGVSTRRRLPKKLSLSVSISTPAYEPPPPRRVCRCECCAAPI